jgi:DHA2 family multidrug resistance protein
VIFVTALQVMIDKGRDLEWFSSGFIVGCGIVAACALVLLVIWELTDPNPVIDLSVFKSRNWLLSTLTLSLMFAIFFGNIVLTPMWLHVQMGYTATWAGYATAPMGILAVVSAPIVGRLLPRIDPRWIVTFGLGVLAISFFMRAHMTSSVDYMTVAVAMFVLGAGIPACIITLTSLGVSDLPPEKVAGGAGLQNFLRIMSMAIGASITQTYWEHMTKHSRAELVAAIDPTIAHGLASKAAAIGFDPESSRSLFSRLVDGQAVMLATNDFYATATLLMLALIALAWIMKRPKGPLVQVTH